MIIMAPSLPVPPAVLGQAAADAALAEAEAAVAGASASLVALEHHPGYALLLPGGFTGVSARRRAETLATVAALQRDLGLYRAAVDRAREARGAGRRAGPAALAQMTDALLGESILVVEEEVGLAERGLLGPTHRTERTTPGAVLAAMTAAFDAVAAVVEAVSTMWDAVADRMGAFDRELGALAADDALAADARRLHERLDALRRRVLADPLAHPVEAALPGPKLDAARAEVDALRHRAHELAALRADLPARVAALGAKVDALAGVEGLAARAADEVARTVAASGAPVPGRRARELRSALRAAHAEAASGRWEAGRSAFSRLEAEVADAHRRAESDHRVLGGLLERRSELRGRLGALRAKASARGRSEDLGLGALHGAARDLLWTVPCDLAAATVAVRRYQRALEEPGSDRPGGPGAGS